MSSQVSSSAVQETKLVRIYCPVCKKSKQIHVPKYVIEESKQVATISIPENVTCEHSFQLFLDKQFKVRGYQKVDYEIPFSDEKAEDSSENIDNDSNLKELYDEFWWLIDDDNQEFQEFIKNDERRTQSRAQSQIIAEVQKNRQ